MTTSQTVPVRQRTLTEVAFGPITRTAFPDREVVERRSTSSILRGHSVLTMSRTTRGTCCLTEDRHVLPSLHSPFTGAGPERFAAVPTRWHDPIDRYVAGSPRLRLSRRTHDRLDVDRLRQVLGTWDDTVGSPLDRADAPTPEATRTSRTTGAPWTT
ncbi:hypothetical protein F0L17_24795 [Streptomyces sp. TRM43335]|uniref:Uncharacterized protein n=1 Tax=Streptomyces taklimakanensis TaxID=2569853 RepID=A0A6G2BJ01_9ACTN|nr:hypothetical protein [Streptomyces taklimakanensis]MTE22261.1 hypothetical protein [Streptomyces taklimakanensis]